jgi:hypothetical protein
MIYLYEKLSFLKATTLISMFGLVLCAVLLINFSNTINELSNDSSFAIRLVTYGVVFDSWVSSPWSILIGHGYLNPLSGVTYQTLYGDNFWLSDIGIVGIMYEFGLLGTAILCYFYVYFFRVYRQTVLMHPNYILRALKDYVVLFLMLLPLAPHALYSIGSVATILAVYIVAQRWRNNEDACKT